MGYYSDVALTLTKKGLKELQESLDAANITQKTKDEVKELFKYSQKHSLDSSSGSKMWYWDSIKWYDYEPEYFPEVDFISSFLNSLDSEEYLFLRIGEDLDDIETLGEYWDNPFDLGISRRIAMKEAV